MSGPDRLCLSEALTIELVVKASVAAPSGAQATTSLV
jgi:hypothetical protein